ncbi:MAG: hypothetical protein AAFV53_25790 [Myxococcota bacterium]
MNTAGLVGCGGGGGSSLTETFTDIIAGGATAPALQVSPSIVDFGEVPFGGRIIQELIVENRGDEPLSVLWMETTLDLDVFSHNVRRGETFPLPLDPGETWSFELTYIAIEPNAGGDIQLRTHDEQVYVDVFGTTPSS